jgi:sulfatase maturation enzyme AslB (radical SAM superfamily)
MASMSGFSKKKAALEPSPTFCVMPWIQLATTTTGRLRVCCHCDTSASSIKKPDGSYYHLGKDSISEAWNSDFYKKIRQEFLDGKEPEMCAGCFKKEKSGIKSMRQTFNKVWLEGRKITIEKTTTPPLAPKLLDLRLGNICNLKCRPCNPLASHQWKEDWFDLLDKSKLKHKYPLDKKRVLELGKIDWSESDAAWSVLESVIPHVQEIYLTGGEPFLSLKQAQLLKKMIESGDSKHITIKYTTNMTTLPSKLVCLWKQFEQIKVNMSIDGVGLVNNYIRYPSKWENIVGNAGKVRELVENGWPIKMGFITTVQAYNAFDLANVFRFAMEFLKQPPYINFLHSPPALSIQSLPQSLKLEVEQSLKGLIHLSEVRDIIDYMNSADLSHLREEFCSYTEELDSIRGEHWIDIAPEFKPIFENRTHF